ncbi:MAG: DUF5615 family PIN-like protein [Opitutaceae bacterium]|jgi:predicted nuclease of predicted toxin-antitoxin system|nr:DUF5615 family PIN-like protein [Opitutaceae bacterium]
MRVLVDMNLSLRWIPFFKTRGIEAVHWETIGRFDESDHVIFDYAIQNGMVIFTNDLDFGTILFQTKNSKPSVIQVRTTDLLPDAVGNLVLTALRQFKAEIENGAIVTIVPKEVKVRVLPL